MAADVIDEDELASGAQRGALFMALWGMADKLAVALAAVVVLPLVESLGFDPVAGTGLRCAEAVVLSRAGALLRRLGRVHLALPADAYAPRGRASRARRTACADLINLHSRIVPGNADPS